MANSPRIIKLKSDDYIEFSVPRNVIGLSKTVTTLIEDYGLDEEDVPTPNTEPIALNIRSTMLEKAIVWCQHHVDDAPFADGERRELSEWDRQFFDVPRSEVLEIIVAANYLQIQSLLNGGCKAVADSLRGLTVAQLREAYNIENDFSPEEQEQMRREHAWIN